MVANDALELLFTGSALLGAALLLLMTLGDGVRLHARVRLPVRVRLPIRTARLHRTDDAALTPMALGALSLFGLGGLLARAAFGFDEAGQLLAGIAFGALGAAFAFSSYAFLDRSQALEPTSLVALVGRRAHVTVSISPAARGAVRLVYDGAVQMLPAVAATPIARGHDVLIDGVRGLAVAVSEIPPP